MEGSGETKNTIAEARDVAPTITKVKEEAVAAEEIAAMQTTPKRHTPIPSSSTETYCTVSHVDTTYTMMGTGVLHCSKKIHLPNAKCDEAHMYEGACMRA